MEVTKRKDRVIAFSLAVMFCILQVLSPVGSVSWNFATRVQAAAGPEDTTGIQVLNASGAAMAIDPNMIIPEVAVAATTTNTIDIQWSAVVNATSYQIYQFDEINGLYQFVTATQNPSYQFAGLPAGEEFYFTVCAVNDVIGCRGDFCVPVHTYTRPEKLPSFTIEGNTATSITLKWADVASATGYIIYRAGTGGNYKKIGTSASTQYVDKGLTSGKTYQYKIVTYAFVEENCGEESPIQFTSTLPAAPSIKVKGGDEKARISWAAITGATGYTVYIYQDSQYVPLVVLPGKSNKAYIHKELTNGETYQYYVTAYRTYNDIHYESAVSNIGKAVPAEVEETSSEPKLYTSKKAFKASTAYKKCKDFSKKVNFNKSIAIPGMSNTNVAGFRCTNMIPQGITIAKSYLFVTAYDRLGEENSVIYVLKKSSQELMTTIVLPNKTHAGGVAFDGKNLWITQSKTLKSIPYSQVSKAIKNQEPYVEVSEYTTDNAVAQQAATVTYYKGLLWVASYDELKAGYLCSYKITSKGSSPKLTLLNTIKMPDRVQGITFTSNGRLLVSRSCQTDSGKRGFLHQIDVYKPNLKKASKGIITLGKVRNQIDMPTMNEELAISGNLLYVNFESVAFPSAVNRMDRICALPVSFMTKLKKAK